MVHRRLDAPRPKEISVAARTLGDIDNDAEDEPGTGRKCDDSIFCSAADSYVLTVRPSNLKNEITGELTLNATSPTMIPRAKNIAAWMNHITPHTGVT